MNGNVPNAALPIYITRSTAHGATMPNLTEQEIQELIKDGKRYHKWVAMHPYWKTRKEILDQILDEVNNEGRRNQNHNQCN